MRDNFGPPEKGKKSSRVWIGPQVILFDNWRTMGWDLLTHGGFLTYPHHDADGFCTFLYPRSGSKIWGIIRVKSSELPTTRKELFEKFDNIIQVQSPDLDDSCVMGTVLVEENDVLYDVFLATVIMIF
jgi:hypothetical protein